MPMVNAVHAKRVCEVCGAVWTPKTRYQAARNKTCSARCAAVSISRKRAGKITAPRTPCMTCGKLTYRAASHLARTKSKQVYCSSSCWGKSRTEHLRAISGMGTKAAHTPAAKAKRIARLTGHHNPAWKGGVTYRKRRGNYVSVRYVRCPANLSMMARADGYVMEHRLVMAEWIKRPLTRTECVHHLDHNPLRNERANLELWPCNRSHKMAEYGRIAEGAANQLSLTD